MIYKIYTFLYETFPIGKVLSEAHQIVWLRSIVHFILVRNRAVQFTWKFGSRNAHQSHRGTRSNQGVQEDDQFLQIEVIIWFLEIDGSMIRS